jgi:RNA polymerase-binding transcription factor DksA
MVKKTIQKKTVAKKPVAEKAKVPAKTVKAKAPVKKTVSVSSKKPGKPVVKVSKPVVKPVAKPVAKVTSKIVAKPIARMAVKPKVKSQVDKKSLKILKDVLLKMRDRLTGQISALSNDSLKYIDDASSEDRTDDFDREFALNLVSSEHDSVFEIEGALRRIEEGVYGVCDSCSCQIEKPRLHALPFCRMCIKCQSEQEKGRSRFRPFGETLAQGVEPTAEVVETEEAE